MRRGKLFAFSRFFVRLRIGRWTAELPPPTGPTVYVCHHGNMAGPLTTLCWLPFPVRPWVLHVFTDRKTCYEQFSGYTFSRRFGLPRPLANCLAGLVSGYVSALMASAGAIPVYRGSLHIGATFRETVAALKAGDSVLIFPDVDYTGGGDSIGAVYDGFLLTDRFWRRASDEPLDFVPLRLDHTARRITAGAPVRFDRTAEQKAELVRVREALRREINDPEAEARTPHPGG